MCCPLVFEFSVGIGGFVIGLGQISFFFSKKEMNVSCHFSIFNVLSFIDKQKIPEFLFAHMAST